MRQNTVHSIWLVSAIGFLNAYTLPSDFKPTEQDLQFVNLGPVVKNRSPPCSPQGSYLGIVDKRQKTTDCVGDCGVNDNVIPESPTIDYQPIKWNTLPGNWENPLELAVNLNSESQDNIFSDGDKDGNNAITKVGLNDATTNILLGDPREHSTLDQTEEHISDGGAGGALDDGFEIAAQKKPGPTVDQDPTTGQPIENSCLVVPSDDPDAYLVHLIEMKTAITYRNPQAILVSQYRSTTFTRYDVFPGPNRQLLYRKSNFAFMSGRKIIPLSRWEPRGWLITFPDEPPGVALAWFEALAQSIAPPRSAPTPDSSLHFSTIWVTHVFNAMANSGSPF